MLDLQLKDDLAWEETLVPYLENECERRLLEDRTQRALELGESMARTGREGVGGIIGTVLTALRCPNFCNGNSQCTEWGCQCYPGHSFYDCSLAISQPVELTDLENSGLSVVRLSQRPGSSASASSTLPNPGCHLTRLMNLNGERRTRATFLSSKVLDCSVPSLNDKPYTRWEVKVTNDGSQYSEPKVLTIYDGVCRVCEPTHSGLCKLNPQLIKREHFILFYLLSLPRSLSLRLSLCLSHSLSLSPLPPVNQPPNLHQPQGGLSTFARENFVFQFTPTDPEGSALLFLLEQDPSRLHALPRRPPHLESPSGGDAGETLQSFEFTLSDECNAQSSYTVREWGGLTVYSYLPHSLPTSLGGPAAASTCVCVCPQGIGGGLCQEDIDACLSAPCAVPGGCADTGDGFPCECPAGLRGKATGTLARMNTHKDRETQKCVLTLPEIRYMSPLPVHH
ncbi:unnamed protein product [Oncorhynchus mykiss]|uniref:EGF-like domain-containing protein n=1 Tax=Oncorhynchus mykiss TaxID=8022 RepID=A0A060X1C7_ONCMY|nr:unnamed protein product [Oncorhynchus mykiss]